MFTCRQSTDGDPLAHRERSSERSAPIDTRAQHPDQLVQADVVALPLGERIADELRRRIIAGDLDPGVHLNESSLAESLGVSRATMRDAVRSLALDGLVEVVPYRGATVRGLVRQDVEDLYAIRTIHEAFAVRRVIASGAYRDLAALGSICDAMAVASGDARGLDALDERFHATLIDLADHALLSTFWRTIGIRVRQVMAMCNREIADGRVIADNHRALVDVIASGDLERAVSAVEAHPRAVIDRVLATFPAARAVLLP